MPITPRRFSSSEREASFVSTPRGLKEPVRWKSSPFRWTGAPVRSPRVAEEKTGVRCRRPAIASRARTTSSRESSAAMERLGRFTRKRAQDGLWLRLVEAAKVADARHEQHCGSRQSAPARRNPERRRDADPVGHGAGEYVPEWQERKGAHPVVGARTRERLLRDVLLEGRLPHGPEEGRRDRRRGHPQSEQDDGGYGEENGQAAAEHRPLGLPAESENAAHQRGNAESGGDHPP